MPALAAAVRAGIAAFGDHPFMVDTVGEPMVVASAPHLSEDVGGVDWYVHLAAPAALEALAVLDGHTKRIARFPLIIGFLPLRPDSLTRWPGKLRSV